MDRNRPMTDDKLNMSLSVNTIMAKLTNQFQRTRDHRLTNTIHLTLKMTSAQVVKTSVTNNSSFQNYLHFDDHTIQTIYQWYCASCFTCRNWADSFQIFAGWVQRSSNATFKYGKEHSKFYWGIDCFLKAKMYTA